MGLNRKIKIGARDLHPGLRMMNSVVIEGIAKIRQLGPDLEVSSYMVKIVRWTKEISHD